MPANNTPSRVNPRASKPWLRMAFFAGAALIIGGTVLGIVYFFGLAMSRPALAAELAKLQPAPGCHEASRTYSPFDIDNQPHFSVVYGCSATAGPTYDSLVSTYQREGFHLTQDYTNPTGHGIDGVQPSLFYSFSFTKKGYSADINFTYANSSGSTDHSSTDLATLKPEPISGYALELTKR